MLKTILRSIIVTLLVVYSTDTIAAALDDYYLQQFGEAGTSAKSSRLSTPAESSEPLHCGMPAKKKLRQDWGKLQPATQKILAKQLAAPVLTGEAILSSTHFRFHYATSGSDAPPSTDLNLNFTPDWVETVATTFEDVYSYYLLNHGYRMPPTTDGFYDIYLRDLAPQSLYGLTTSTTALPATGYPNSFGSYMEIDNDFTDSKFVNASGGPYSPTQSLQITASHEFHHAIQYGYNYFFDIWYAEATSTWYEDELYDSVNQLYNYLPAWFSNSTKSLDIPVLNDGTALTTGAGYSRWLFNRYLAERFGSGVIRNAWQSLAGLSSPDGNLDISMAPVLNTLLTNTYSSTLATEFSGFSRSAYLRDWVSHTNEISKIHDIVPVASYSKYPVNTLTSPQPKVTLPHYSFAYYTFTPSPAVTALTITVNQTTGITSTVFLNRNGFVTEITPNIAGTTYIYTANGFSQLNAATDKVVLLLANTTSIDNHSATFSTDGNSPAVTEPTASVSGSSGGGSGCFIATAAYGSYLHPQVQTLRDFRDRHLLTNAAGRAFVAFYYSVSPPIADFIAQHEILKILVRWCLTPLIFAVAHPLVMIAAFIILAAMVILKRRSKRLPIAAVNPTSEVI